MKRIVLVLLLVAYSVSAFSLSEALPVAPAPHTLQQQYKNLKADLEIINGFRMIKMFTMDRFWVTVEDSLQVQKAKLRELAALIARQQKEMQALTMSLSKIEKENQALTTGVDNLIIFGKAYSKSGFIVVVSFVMLGLAVLAGILFSIGRVSLYTTRELRKLNESMYQEFDTYKRNAVEKEIKLSRELQNHRNKLAELKMA
jgi:hypothetical protein